MHNINYIRENPVEFDNFMKTRGENPIANKIIEIDKIIPKTIRCMKFFNGLGLNFPTDSGSSNT